MFSERSQAQEKYMSYLCRIQHEENLICGLRNCNRGYILGGEVVTRRVPEGGLLLDLGNILFPHPDIDYMGNQFSTKNTVKIMFLCIILLVSYIFIKS